MDETAVRDLLRRYVGDDEPPMRTTVPQVEARGRRLRRRRQVLAGVAVMAAAASVTVVARAIVPGVADTAPAAWSVEAGENGTFTVAIRELDEPERLQRVLAEQGIKAHVVFVPAGKRCAPGTPRYQVLPPEEGSIAAVPLARRSGEASPGPASTAERAESRSPVTSLTFRDSGQGPDETFVLLVVQNEAALVEGRPMLRMSYANAVGPVAPCQLEDDR